MAYIPGVSPAALPPYAISAPSYRFRALAALAGRAPLGGAREVALACTIGARLAVVLVRGDVATDDETRAARAAGARHWLASAALPAPTRSPMLRLYDATARPVQPDAPAMLPPRRTRTSGSTRAPSAGAGTGGEGQALADLARQVAEALRAVIDASATWLDTPSRIELSRLADELGTGRGRA